MTSSRVLGAVIGLAGLAPPASAAESPFRPVPGSAWSQDPATGCRFVRPASLTAGPTYWAGACRSGKAEGLGMLRRRDGGASSAAFYGELRDGVPAIGVLDLADGYMVGRSSTATSGHATPNSRNASIPFGWRRAPPVR